MRILRRRHRLGLAVIVAAVAAGLAGGIVYARESDRALAQGPPQLIAKGKFRSLTWGTLGTASLVREPSGDLRLRLSSNFMTKDSPELYVYLAKLQGEQRLVWKQVGPLKSSQGAQEYPVSSEAAKIPGIQVAIYCAKCNKISGLAPLAATR